MIILPHQRRYVHVTSEDVEAHALWDFRGDSEGGGAGTEEFCDEISNVFAKLRTGWPGTITRIGQAFTLYDDKWQTRNEWFRRCLATGEAFLPFAKASPDDYVLSYCIGGILDMMGQIDRKKRWVGYLLALARCAQYQFPMLRLNAKQAAAFALSDITEEQGESIRAPWPAFIFVADNAFHPNGETEYGTVVLQVRSRWRGQGKGGGAVFYPIGQWYFESRFVKREISSSYIMTRDIVNRVMVESNSIDGSGPRSAMAIEHACLNACLAIAAGNEGVLRVSSTRRRKKFEKMRGAIVLFKRYTIGTPVTVDMREHVRNYINGASKRLFKVRWVVRGHWRNQPCGPGMSLRKLKWIEPYWKGPEKAPKLVRRHEIADGQGVSSSSSATRTRSM